MQTPRFSGQPIRAGDLVLEIIPSRPMRTSCENVGTVFLFFRSAFRIQDCEITAFRAQNAPQTLATRAHKTREHTHTLKGVLRIRREPARTPHALQETDVTLSVSNRRTLLGFSGLAPHSGRSSVPFRRSCSGTEEFLPTSHAPYMQHGRTAGVRDP